MRKRAAFICMQHLPIRAPSSDHIPLTCWAGFSGLWFGFGFGSEFWVWHCRLALWRPQPRAALINYAVQCGHLLLLLIPFPLSG